MAGHNSEGSSPIEDSEVKQKLDEEVMVIHETDIVDEEDDIVTEDDEDDEDDDGHPSWYEPTQCWRCNSLFTPSSEEATDYCDSCQVKIDQLQEDL